MNEEKMQEEFQDHFRQSPYEWTFERFADTQAWPGSYRNFSCECAWDAWQAACASRQEEIDVGNTLPSPALTWLYSHCVAIGMTCKSTSGLWEHDIALFTAGQKEEIANWKIVAENWREKAVAWARKNAEITQESRNRILELEAELQAQHSNNQEN